MFEFGGFGIKRSYRPGLGAATGCFYFVRFGCTFGLAYSVAIFFPFHSNHQSGAPVFDLWMDVRRFSLRKSEVIPMFQSSEVELKLFRGHRIHSAMEEFRLSHRSQLISTRPFVGVHCQTSFFNYCFGNLKAGCPWKHRMLHRWMMFARGYHDQWPCVLFGSMWSQEMALALPVLFINLTVISMGLSILVWYWCGNFIPLEGMRQTRSQEYYSIRVTFPCPFLLWTLLYRVL